MMERDSERLRVYLADYLRQRGISTKRAFRCLSPQHEDKHPSMRYNPDAENVHCFSCGVSYDIFDLVGMDYKLDAFPEQLGKVAELFGETLQPRLQVVGERRTTPPAEKQLEKRTDIAPVSAPVDRSAELQQVRAQSDGELRYLASRGITRESAEKYQLFESGGRAYFPVFDDGVCVGWSARAVSEDVSPRYKNSTGALGVWNADKLKSDGKGKRLFVTEGVIDAISLEQVGCDAVALCGSQNTAKLLRLCERYAATANTWRFVLSGDADDAGRKMNELLAAGLKAQGLSHCVLELPANTDINDLYRKNPDGLKTLLRDTDNMPAVYESTSASAALEDFFRYSGARAGQAVPTGFTALDRMLDGGLYPGLYVIGAISSIGKTSFVLQIADTIAETARDVLYISLEQSRYELMAKSLSRTSAALAGEGKGAMTARQLLGGETLQKSAFLQQVREAYAQAAAGLYIREGMADIGAAEIRKMVQDHVAARGVPPVVIVDYLQILTPADKRATDKQNTDRNVVELRRLSRDFDIPVIAISSFNRENYKAAVSMEAFKESGAVEYSADVLLGLQLSGAGERDFDVNEAKLREPRQLELVLLKNRSGIPYGKVRFDYDARYSLFWEPCAMYRRGLA